MNFLTSNTKNTVRMLNSRTGQTSKILSVDGDVVGIDSNAGIGMINTVKGNSRKTYMFDLNKGSLLKLFSR